MSVPEPHAWAGFSRSLSSELVLVFGRRRNQMGLLVLAAVPLVMAVAMRSSSHGMAGGLLSGNGLIVPVTALIAEAPFFLPLAIAMLAGDAVAGEANQGTLRYLLTVPVGRSRLLAVKFAAIVVGALVAVALVAVVAVVLGAALFGVVPTTSLSGTTLDVGTALGRVALVVLYIWAGTVALGAVGLFASTVTEQPLAATISTMVVVALSWVAEGVSQLAWLQPWLVTHWFASALDLVRDPILTTNVQQGLALDAAWIVVLYLAAWARLTTKDITS